MFGLKQIQPMKKKRKTTKKESDGEIYVTLTRKADNPDDYNVEAVMHGDLQLGKLTSIDLIKGPDGSLAVSVQYLGDHIDGEGLGWVVASEPPKTPLQEFTERVWSDEDETDEE